MENTQHISIHKTQKNVFECGQDDKVHCLKIHYAGFNMEKILKSNMLSQHGEDKDPVCLAVSGVSMVIN